MPIIPTDPNKLRKILVDLIWSATRVPMKKRQEIEVAAREYANAFGDERACAAHMRALEDMQKIDCPVCNASLWVTFNRRMFSGMNLRIGVLCRGSGKHEIQFQVL